MVLAADCLPVLLWRRDEPGVAAAHAGWRGLVGGVVGAAVRALGRPERIGAAIGPGIGPCCYPVSAEVRDRFAAAFGEAVVRPPAVNLAAAARAALVAEGVEAPAIATVQACTSCDPEPLLLLPPRRRGQRAAGGAGVGDRVTIDPEAPSRGPRRGPRAPRRGLRAGGQARRLGGARPRGQVRPAGPDGGAGGGGGRGGGGEPPAGPAGAPGGGRRAAGLRLHRPPAAQEGARGDGGGAPAPLPRLPVAGRRDRRARGRSDAGPRRSQPRRRARPKVVSCRPSFGRSWRMCRSRPIS